MMLMPKRKSRNMLRTMVTGLLMLACAIGVSAKTYIVACGISDYPGTDSDLPNPANDARSVAWLFQKNKEGNVAGELLINSNATTQNIISAMRRVFSKARPDDTVLFFFSGHGSRGTFVAYDGKIPYGTLSQILASSAARNKMIIADACYAGKFREQGGAADLARVAQNGSVMLFLSSRGNEESIDSPDLKNGLFTAYLMRALRGRADRNRNRVITARELFEYVSEGVTKMSRNRQHPVMWGNFKDSMPILSWPKKKKR